MDLVSTNQQQWEMVYLGEQYIGAEGRTESYYAFYNSLTGLCMDVYGGATAEGSRLTTWPCHGGPNKDWY
jgi:hypothetical protein